MIERINLIEVKLKSLKDMYGQRHKKALQSEANQLFDDTKYRWKFKNVIGPQIYMMHLNEYFTCCAFCKRLDKSSCHEYCFKCTKGTYNDCSSLLPGTFSFAGSYFDSLEDSYTPWIFRTPCTSFERLDNRAYFRNFTSYSRSVTDANYEALEGIFLGICRGKRPCHICASVNMDIFNKCSKEERTAENSPCSKVISEISAKYEAISGMIKYVE